MKKIVLIICLIFLGIISFLTYKYFTTPVLITPEEAKKIAMDDVSNKDNNYSFNSIEFNEEDKDKSIYTIIFNDNNNNYTYKIDAKSKKIISHKKQSLEDNKTYMKDSDVLNIALKHANLNKMDCNILENTVNLESGIPVYNILFYSNNIKYNYRINAYTGSIISVIKSSENAE